jgi:hypothetical protein
MNADTKRALDAIQEIVEAQKNVETAARMLGDAYEHVEDCKETHTIAVKALGVLIQRNGAAGLVELVEEVDQEPACNAVDEQGPLGWVCSLPVNHAGDHCDQGARRTWRQHTVTIR